MPSVATQMINTLYRFPATCCHLARAHWRQAKANHSDSFQTHSQLVLATGTYDNASFTHTHTSAPTTCRHTLPCSTMKMIFARMFFSNNWAIWCAYASGVSLCLDSGCWCATRIQSAGRLGVSSLRLSTSWQSASQIDSKHARKYCVIYFV